MKWMIIFVLVMAWRIGYSQNTHGFYVNYGIESYTLSYDEIYSGIYYWDYVKSDIITSHIASASFVKYKGKFIRELEIMPFSLSTKLYSNYYISNKDTFSLDGKRVSKASMYLRYFKGYSVGSPDKKVVLYLGLSGGIKFDHLTTRPSYSSSFDLFNNNVITDISFNPYLKWRFKNNYFFTIGIPFKLVEFGLLVSREENPQLPEALRKITTFDFAFIPKNYMVKIGLGVEF
jgi:hypothetical protein